MNKHITKKDLYGMNKNMYIVTEDIRPFLSSVDCIGYNAGVYGWNWTAWLVNNKIFIMGYRNFPQAKIIKHEKLINLKNELSKIEYFTEEYNEYKNKLFYNFIGGL